MSSGVNRCTLAESNVDFFYLNNCQKVTSALTWCRLGLLIGSAEINVKWMRSRFVRERVIGQDVTWCTRPGLRSAATARRRGRRLRRRPRTASRTRPTAAAPRARPRRSRRRLGPGTATTDTGRGTTISAHLRREGAPSRTTASRTFFPATTWVVPGPPASSATRPRMIRGWRQRRPWQQRRSARLDSRRWKTCRGWTRTWN